MKTLFYSPHLGVRGTEVALFDYAYYNQAILNNESIICYSKNHFRNDSTAIKRFKDHFKVLEVEDHKMELVEQKIIEEKADYFYMIKGGKNDGFYSKVAKSLIHCTACQNDPHGDVYAYVSQFMTDFCSKGELPFVPHIIDLPEVEGDLRKEYGIPEDAVVFGRTGGEDTFNLPFGPPVVEYIAEKFPNYFFLLQNTPKFCNLPNVIHIPTTSDINFKVKFINTCDAMLHCRHEGESFGIACGEFSIKNKPIITWNGSQERNHIMVLQDNGIYYNNSQQLCYILENFKELKKFKEDNSTANWNCYQKFNPKEVMKKFKEVFYE